MSKYSIHITDTLNFNNIEAGLYTVYFKSDNDSDFEKFVEEQTGHDGPIFINNEESHDSVFILDLSSARVVSRIARLSLVHLYEDERFKEYTEDLLAAFGISCYIKDVDLEEYTLAMHSEVENQGFIYSIEQGALDLITVVLAVSMSTFSNNLTILINYGTMLYKTINRIIFDMATMIDSVISNKADSVLLYLCPVLTKDISYRASVFIEDNHYCFNV